MGLMAIQIRYREWRVSIVTGRGTVDGVRGSLEKWGAGVAQSGVVRVECWVVWFADVRAMSGNRRTSVCASSSPVNRARTPLSRASSASFGMCILTNTGFVIWTMPSASSTTGKCTTMKSDQTVHWVMFHRLCSPDRLHDMVAFPHQTWICFGERSMSQPVPNRRSVINIMNTGITLRRTVRIYSLLATGHGQAIDTSDKQY